MAGKYELYSDKAGKFRFRLKAGNGQVIASSEAYESKALAHNGIASVKAKAGSETVDLTEGDVRRRVTSRSFHSAPSGRGHAPKNFADPIPTTTITKKQPSPIAALRQASNFASAIPANTIA